MKNHYIGKARKAIKIISHEENISREEIRSEMKAAIAEGLSSSDPAAQEIWKNIPCKGEAPEPEELIAWLAEQVRVKVKN